VQPDIIARAEAHVPKDPPGIKVRVRVRVRVRVS